MKHNQCNEKMANWLAVFAPHLSLKCRLHALGICIQLLFCRPSSDILLFFHPSFVPIFLIQQTYACLKSMMSDDNGCKHVGG